MKNEIDELYRAEEGWDKPGHSDEEHYFVGTVSLCGKWALFSSTLRKHPDLALPACQECKVRLMNRKEGQLWKREQIRDDGERV